jgi:hypothetical protein
MAQVARTPEGQAARSAQPDIDYHLDYQFRAWRSVPEYAEWWPDMDVVDKEVFHLEWVGITESRLADLRQWAEEGRLSLAQRARYDELLQLVAKYRPVVDGLLET